MPPEVNHGLFNVTDKRIDHAVQESLSIIDEVITKFFKHENN